MKYQLNWHLFNLSNNYLLKKKIDNCIILNDDKEYISVNLKYYQDILFITEENTVDFNKNNSNLIQLFKNNIEYKLKELLDYDEYYLAPIYSNIITKQKKQISVINIGIFILSKFKFKSEKYNETIFTFFLSIKYGIVPSNDNIEDLKTNKYPELKSNIDNILYYKQSGFYFNLLRCINYSYKSANLVKNIELPINSKNELHILDIGELFENAHSYWSNWQIIWRNTNEDIRKFLKFKPKNNMEFITDNETKKYRNIVVNQNLMSQNRLINSIFDNSNNNSSNSNNIRNNYNENNYQKLSNYFIPIKDNLVNSNDKFNDKCNENEKMTNVISKLSKLSFKNNDGECLSSFPNRIKNYSKFSGSKHLHYLKKEKVKDKAIIEMLRGLNF